MDLLAKELASKKQSLAKAKTKFGSCASGGRRRFFRTKDLQKLKEQEEEEKLKEKEKEQIQKKQLLLQNDNDNRTNDDNHNHENEKKEDKKEKQKNRKRSRNHDDDIEAAEDDSDGIQNKNNDNKRQHYDNDDDNEDNKESKKGNKNKKNRNNDSDNYIDANNTGSNNDTTTTTTTTNVMEDDNNDNNNNNMISEDELVKRLRSFGLAIRLFGESKMERIVRLNDALKQQQHVLEGLSEKDEFRLNRGHGIRNPFLEKDNNENNNDYDDYNDYQKKKKNKKKKQKDQNTTNNDEINSTNNNNNQGKTKTTNNNHNNHNDQQDNDNDDDNTAAKKTTNNNDNDDNEDDDDYEDDPHKQVYKYFKSLLKQWENELSNRSDIISKSIAGKNEYKTCKQCKDYIRPLFKLCKSRRLESSLLHNLVDIVKFAKMGEFVKANDKYMDVAIGRAAWPIGVTMVGIHARTGRSKIESSNVAHVMNSELQRKYLTSVKRLLSYAQKISNVAPSKQVR